MLVQVQGNRSVVTFELAGGDAGEYVAYLDTLKDNAKWKEQIDYMSDAGKSSVLITNDPNDLPSGVRSSLYNQVYGATEVSGAMTNAWTDRTNSSFVLLNTGAGLLTDKQGVPVLDTDGLPRERDPFVVFVHEAAHVGEPPDVTPGHAPDFGPRTSGILNLVQPAGGLYGGTVRPQIHPSAAALRQAPSTRRLRYSETAVLTASEFAPLRRRHPGLRLEHPHFRGPAAEHLPTER
jgi:hypothetical protein